MPTNGVKPKTGDVVYTRESFFQMVSGVFEAASECGSDPETTLETIRAIFEKIKEADKPQLVCECKKPGIVTDATYCFKCHRPTAILSRTYEEIYAALKK